MTKKRKKVNFRWVKGVLPYIVAGIVTIALVFVGSIDKNNSAKNLSLDAFAANDYKISTDQLSELYVVADLSDTLGLASATDVASNYVITTTMYDSGQTSSGKLEKPNIVDIIVSRGVIKYVVSDGEDMESIASKYGISTDQIRWSNGLKTTNISAGDTLYIPSAPGIIYTVKEDDTIESIVEKYGSSVTEVIALNDLELSGISEGMKILIKGGTLPETERPEYVPPVVVRSTYTYLGDTSERKNITQIAYYPCRGGVNEISVLDEGRNRNGCGQCTQWAWHMRQDLPSLMGNANAWARNAAAAGFVVDHTPSAGAIFQTSSGWYGHVGYVEAVNEDGSITVTEMNYNYRVGLVIRATIPANVVGNFNYIH